MEENGFRDSYQSVKRFVRKLRAIQPERVWCLECQPGEELQLDFGLGAPIDVGQGKNAPQLGVALSLELFAQGLQRSGEQAGHRDVPSLSGKRAAQLWR